MMEEVFVSYIVPCYNIQDYLPYCLESLRKQRIQEGAGVEFVLVNDGSTDETLSIIKDYAQKDDRVVVVDQRNQGVCAARNHGLKVAKGRFVFFLDGDDCLTDNASEIIYNFCKESNPDVVLFGNYKLQEGQSEGKEWINPARFCAPGIYSKEEYIEKASYFPISFKLYRREFLADKNIKFDEQLVAGEVYTFYIHTLTMASYVGVSLEFVMFYLKRKGESATTIIDVNRDLSILDTLHVVNGYVNELCPRLMGKRAYLASSFWLVTAFAVIKYVGRSRYTKEIGQLLCRVKSDEQYRVLLTFFTGRGISITKHSLLATCIRFFPPRIAYTIIRSYYRFATKRNTA